MKGINLPEFGSPEEFVDLHDIVKQHAEQDSTWTTEIEKVASMAPGQVQKFMEHLIKAQAVLQQLSVKIIKYREQDSRSERNSFSPDGPTQVPVCQHMRGTLQSNGRNMRRVIHFSKTI
jgi:hypothetical protein